MKSKLKYVGSSHMTEVLQAPGGQWLKVNLSRDHATSDLGRRRTRHAVTSKIWVEVEDEQIIALCAELPMVAE